MKSGQNLTENMKVLLLLLIAVSLALTTKLRRKRQAYELPDGAHLLIGSIRTNFFCDKDGYFADVEIIVRFSTFAIHHSKKGKSRELVSGVLFVEIKQYSTN
ncbi:uncharacterized protein [Centruroides vittatus]|uniref:uncharacterized protein n=1 Tax=Centruroides vittatus TaxID=120091 RepID=UPI00350F4DC1